MFDNLSERLGGTLDRLTRRGALTEADVDAAMREVRRALLEADVSLDVVRSFTEKVREQAIGATVVKSVTPGQMVVKIVHDELVATFSDPRATRLHVERQRVVAGRQQPTRLARVVLTRDPAEQVHLVGQTDAHQRATRTLRAVDERWRRDVLRRRLSGCNNELSRSSSQRLVERDHDSLLRGGKIEHAALTHVAVLLED